MPKQPTDNTTVAFMRLVEIMATLRSPGGCPWDAEQTPETLKPYIIEEAYEVLDAIDHGDPEEVCEELGDLLLQVVFQARIFEELGAFCIEDVAQGIAEKLIRRHPHVFAGQTCSDPSTLHAQWEAIKAGEKIARGDSPSPRPTIPRHLPALQRAQKVTKKTEWHGAGNLTTPLELASGLLNRFSNAAEEGDRTRQEPLLGELLLTLSAIANTLNLDAEDILRKASSAHLETASAPLETGSAVKGKTPPPSRK